MKRFAVRRLVAGLLVVACVAPGSFAAQATVPVGQNVGKLAFKDIRYLPRSLADFSGKKAFVIVCTNTTCPLVQRYLPKLKRLDEKYRGQGLQFVSLNVGPGDSIREMAAHAVGFDLAFPTVKDVNGETVAALGVTRTPEAVVLGHDFVLRYRGRIDDQYRLSGANQNSLHNDLENAIEAVLAGKPVSVAETTVDGCLITHAAAPAHSSAVTYNKDIAPILRKHCVECHQPNTEAPFSLLSYEDAKKQGATMAEVVGDEAMPPWYASAAHGDFLNRREMSATERDTIAAWVQGGMPRGDRVADSTPIPLRKVVGEGWLIGKPDLVVRTKLHSVPADGFVKYRYEPLSYVFPQDTWIDRIQILPDNPKVVHHCNLILIPAFGDKVKNALFVTGKVPGGIPMELNDGIAVRVPKMYLPLLQIHFTTDGHEEKCRIAVGFRYAREKVQKEMHLERISSHDFAIAAGDPHYKVAQSWQTKRDIVGIGLFTHMHVRGTDMTYLAHYPDGKTETLLLVPNYSFDWQIGYAWAAGARKFPAGTRFEVVAHYDNSPFNPFNPDPKKTVREGDQTTEEMMYGFLFYTVAAEHLNLDIDPKTGVALPSAKLSSR
ncbi:MAG TPA: redoxin domain-containing protein [Planctomycetaceae bacterium]|jgi:mono/diheme cytochrome c family protein/thiol-disulfide isomerase/thioredoxin|nr:redoxin domain-containing protein [Planctomycetaceae bacterium]